MTHTTEHFRDSLRAARRSGTPLTCIRTADPASAINHFVCSLNGKADVTPLLQYDIINGLKGTNKVGREAASGLGDLSPDPIETLTALPKILDDSVIFVFNAQRIWEGPQFIQGTWNLRDVFKSHGQMLILLTTMGATLPTELQSDVMVFDEPLPSLTDIEAIIDFTLEAADLPKLDAEIKTKASDALIGLASYPAEQVLSMSLSKTGVNIPNVWERKCTTIEQTRGLSVHRGTESFADVRGCDALVEYLTAFMHGEDAPRGVVFIDEINDAFAGSGTDTSGTKGELLGVLLSHLQDRNADGILLLGPPGTGKTLIGKATASVTDKVMINFDFSGMQSGIVGSSGEYLRTGLAVVDATTQGRALWIGTCNSLSNLPPQLRRRFRDGCFFVDTPDENGRRALWELNEKRFNVSGKRPYDVGWTGAEIENCCRKARRLKMSLLDSAKYIVPVSKSMGDQIDDMRRAASGKFLSASKPGVYDYVAQEMAVAAPGGRKIRKEN